MAVPRTESTEDYVRAIYELGGDGSAVSTSALAEHLGVSSASVTGMVKRLDAAGLVSHEPYAGVRLTRAGETVALEVTRHHRLIETYLADAMGLPWDKVHEEAHRLEHHISEELEDRMAELLGNPERDPHGAPIPPKSGPFVAPRYRTLAETAPGERLVIREVEDEDGERLRYLAELGLQPDVEIVVRDVAPFEGPITVAIVPSLGARHADRSADAALSAPVALGRALAATIAVQRA